MDELTQQPQTKKCPFCAQEIPAEAKKCHYCDEWLDRSVSSDARLPVGHEEKTGFSHAQPVWQFALLSGLTLGLYLFYWFYRNWKDVGAHHRIEFHPGWRTLGLFVPGLGWYLIYTQLREIKKFAAARDVAVRYIPVAATLTFIVLSVFDKLEGAGRFVSLLALIPLIPVQQTLNAYWATEQPDRRVRGALSGKEIAALAIGIILTLLSVVGTFSDAIESAIIANLPLDPSATTIFVLKNTAESAPANFQELLADSLNQLGGSDGFFVPFADSGRELRTAEQIFDSYNTAVVAIGTISSDGDLSFGSGFLVGTGYPQGGVVATNYHVIENAERVAVVFPGRDNEAGFVSWVVAADKDKDLALLKIITANEGTLPSIPAGDSNSVRPGHGVFVIGSPEGFANTISTGIVSQIREFAEGGRSFQITAPISFGSSGGPVFNQYGEVIGVTNATVLDGQNINFAIPINYLRDLVPVGEQ